MAKRIISSAILIVITLAALVFDSFYTSLLVLVMAVIATWEYYHAFNKAGKKPMKLPLIICLFVPIGLSLAVFLDAFIDDISYDFTSNMVQILLFILIVPCISLVCVMFEFVLNHKKYNIESGAISFLGGIYVSIMFSFVTLIRIVGLDILIFGLLSSLLCDTFALFTGILFGKHKLCESISPKKTVEGAIGGVIGSAAICIAYYFVCPYIFGRTFPIPLWLTVVLAIILPVFAQIGDLFASAIKRECQIKDFGNLIPGHGGILDRVDSVLVTVFVLYIVLFLVVNPTTILL